LTSLRVYKKNAATAIDNIFIDATKMSDYYISPIVNGLSDHDAQFLTIRSYNLDSPAKQYMLIRKMDDYRIQDFLARRSHENWESVFSTDDVNTMFNTFLDTYLKIFYHSFPTKRVLLNKRHNEWITLGIKTSCKRKR
jgi:hypothetical protein